MSCAAFTLLGMWILYANKSNGWSLQATFGLAGLCLFWACFLAWKDEHMALDKCRKMLELRLPSLGVEVWDVIVVPGLNSAEVFLDVSVSNGTPDTETLVREFLMEIEIAGKRFRAERNRVDLADYGLINRRDIKGAIIAPNQFTPMADLAMSMSEKNPILFGVPHRGWLHFPLRDLPYWTMKNTGILHFIRAHDSSVVSENSLSTVWGYWVQADEMQATVDLVGSAILSVDGYVGSDATFLASVNKTEERLVVLLKT